MLNLQTSPHIKQHHYNPVVVIAVVCALIVAIIPYVICLSQMNIHDPNAAGPDYSAITTHALIAFFVVMGYLFPAYIAFKRDAESRWILFGVNFMIGWTLIVWFICLVWATMMPKTTPIVFVQSMPENSNAEPSSKA